MLRKTTKWLIDQFKVDFFLGTRDRTVLERKIIPWLSTQPEMARVLFVGCEWYTYGYRKWFPEKTYWTLDYNPKKRVFGSANLHIVDSMTNLAAYFGPETLDLVICNGVFGWGLNARSDVEAAFFSVHEALRPGGYFLLGWNDIPKRRPISLENITALRAFSAAIIEPLGASQYSVQGSKRHVYNLYVKSCDARNRGV